MIIPLLEQAVVFNVLLAHGHLLGLALVQIVQQGKLQVLELVFVLHVLQVILQFLAQTHVLNVQEARGQLLEIALAQHV